MSDNQTIRELQNRVSFLESQIQLLKNESVDVWLVLRHENNNADMLFARVFRYKEDAVQFILEDASKYGFVTENFNNKDVVYYTARSGIYTYKLHNMLVFM